MKMKLTYMKLERTHVIMSENEIMRRSENVFTILILITNFYVSYNLS